MNLDKIHQMRFNHWFLTDDNLQRLHACVGDVAHVNASCVVFCSFVAKCVTCFTHFTATNVNKSISSATLFKYELEHQKL